MIVGHFVGHFWGPSGALVIVGHFVGQFWGPQRRVLLIVGLFVSLGGLLPGRFSWLGLLGGCETAGRLLGICWEAAEGWETAGVLLDWEAAEIVGRLFGSWEAAGLS